MAAPQRRPRNRTDPQRINRRPEGMPREASGRAPGGAWQSGARRGRAFLVLVLVPVLLMLGSVYLHTVATGFEREAARLEEERSRGEGEGERLEVRLTELSEPGRIRALASDGMGMRDPTAEDLETLDGTQGEDTADGGGEKEEEKAK